MFKQPEIFKQPIVIKKEPETIKLPEPVKKQSYLFKQPEEVITSEAVKIPEVIITTPLALKIANCSNQNNQMHQTSQIKQNIPESSNVKKIFIDEDDDEKNKEIIAIPKSRTLPVNEVSVDPVLLKAELNPSSK